MSILNEESHYNYLRKVWMLFLKELGIDGDKCNCGNGMIVAHGDKGYCYKEKWEKAKIPFNRGMALFFLPMGLRKFNDEVKQTKNCLGWPCHGEWVKANYEKFKPVLEKVELIVDNGEN